MLTEQNTPLPLVRQWSNLTVDGMDVEVPEDVYLAYSQADRRDRYITEEQSSGKLLSLEQMENDALLPDYVGAETAPSAETEALEREELRNLAEQKQILLLALLSLKDTDRELINALFFDGASTRENASFSRSTASSSWMKPIGSRRPHSKCWV